MGILDAPGLSKTTAQAAFTARQPAQKLHGFYAGLAARHLSPCNILVTGDSYVEGQGSTAVANRWVDLFRDRIRERFPTPGVVGGLGFVPANYVMTTPASQGFTAAGNTAGTSFGFGSRARVLGPTVGSGVGTMTITRTCTSFDVLHHASSSQTFSVTIDGGAATNVTGSGASGGDLTWTSPALTDGAHTIVISQVTGTPTIEGAMFYRGDETKGIRVWEAGRAGSRAGNFITGGTFGTNWSTAVGRVAWNLIIVETIINDTAAQTATQYQADLTSYVSLLRTLAPNSAIAIMPSPTRPDAIAPLSPWADYVTAAQAVADAATKCALLNVGDRIPRLNPDTYGLLSDGLHPNDKGHALLADAYLGLLVPAGN